MLTDKFVLAEEFRSWDKLNEPEQAAIQEQNRQDLGAISGIPADSELITEWAWKYDPVIGKWLSEV